AGGQGVRVEAARAGAGAVYLGRKVPIAQPLDTDGDGIDDVYELQHSSVLNPLDPSDAARDSDGDGLSNLEEFKRGTDPTTPNANTPLTTIASSSPSNGETGVAVTRETIIRFSGPLQEGSTLGPNQLYA